MTERGKLICLLVPVVAVFGFISWQVLGPSAHDADADACETFWKSDKPLFWLGHVTLDQGMKAWGRRAERAAQIADDDQLKAALARFSEEARSKTWNDTEAEAASQRGAAVLLFCPN